MTHPRKTIRDAVVGLLNTGTIVASGRVYSNRSRPIWEESLPEINVYSRSEESTVDEMGSPPTLLRTLELLIEVTAVDTDDETLDDTLDALAKKIEDALKVDPTWGVGAVGNSTLTGTEFSSSSEGEQPIGSATLIYSVNYVST